MPSKTTEFCSPASIPCHLSQKDSFANAKTEAYLKKKELYKKIMIKYDTERDHRLAHAE